MQISYNQETYTLTQEAYLDGIGNDLSCAINEFPATAGMK